MIRIVLADDHKIFRQGLAELLDSDPRFRVVGMASDGAEALSMVNALSPDLLILDISMPVMDGFDVLGQLRKNQHPVRVLLLSMHKDPLAIQKALDLGADGYVLKEEAFDELSLAIDEAVQGRSFLSPLARKTLLSRGVVEDVELSPREREIVEGVALGKTTKEIALQLDISAKTVETYRQRIMFKLGCHKLTEIVRYAIAKGIIPP